jgi:thiol-disulfide isomerase/thioredoxin
MFPLRFGRSGAHLPSFSGLLGLLICSTAACCMAAASEGPGRLKKARNLSSKAATAKLRRPLVPPGDHFPMPEGDGVALLQFAKKIARIAPKGESDREQIAHQHKVARTIARAADKLLRLERNGKQAASAHQLRLQALSILRGLGEPGADRLLDDAIGRARTDPRLEIANIGMKFFLESHFTRWQTLDERQKRLVVEGVVDYIIRGELVPHHAEVLSAVVNFLDGMEENQRISRLLHQTLPYLRQSKNPEMEPMVATLEGIERRFNLPGHPMQISGTLLDGTEIDWSSYRGKIVLVDFWSTQCGPCRAEVPNILQQYQSYYEKGFDVVGVCLDENKRDVEEYVKHTEIPWVVLFPARKEERGWQHPLAAYYGITAIPQAILVDRDGTVIDMNARGELLARQLRKRLGEPLAKIGRSQSTMIRQVSGTPTAVE